MPVEAQGKLKRRFTGEAWSGLGYAVVAVTLFSFSPVLVRMAAPLSPSEIAFGRLGVAAIVLLALASTRRVSLKLSRREWLRFAVYGLVTALHFWLYIASLSYTTIAHSLSLVYTAPVFTAILSALWLREGLPRRSYAGIAVAAMGVAVLAGFEPTMSVSMLMGDLMALGSAVCFGVYSVAGRRERDNYDIAKYAAFVYAMGAAWLLPPALIAYSGQAALSSSIAVVALGVFPLAIGHTLYNVGLRRTQATYVNLVATQEVTGGVLLGWLLLAEAPGPQALAGAALTLLGVGTVVYTASRSPGKHTE